MTGKLVALEGIDSAGKTTVRDNLAESLRSCRVPIVICKERQSPYGHLLAKESLAALSPLIKAYLFAADRAWTYVEVGLPAFQEGSLVIWDRYVDSAIAYRGAEIESGRANFDMDLVKHINAPFRRPDLTLFFQVSIPTSIERSERARKPQPYERAILTKVHSQYEKLALEHEYAVIDAESDPETCLAQAATIIRTHFLDMFPEE